MPVERWENSSTPAITAVVPTYPDNDHERVMELLRRQRFDQGYEVVIVNDGSVDICEARNIGIEAARANIVAITDDDTEPPADWLQSIWDAFRRNPSAVCVEGSVEGGINYDGRRRYVGCNLAVDREAALAIGGFDPRYAGWRDDTEFGWRMESEADGACVYEASVQMVHPSHPRSAMVPSLERQLEKEYPDRYGAVMNGNIVGRVWRLGQRIGVVPVLNRIRN